MVMDERPVGLNAAFDQAGMGAADRAFPDRAGWRAAGRGR